MWEASATAAVASMLAGIVSQQPRRYEFWRSWVPRRFCAGLFLYLLAHGLLGLLAALLAKDRHWQPIGDDWLWNGLIYAAGGQTVIRVAPQVLVNDLRSAHTLLARAVEFVVAALNLASEGVIERRLSDLEDNQLAAQAADLYGRYTLVDETITTGARQTTLESIEAAGTKLSGATTRAEARAILERFCLAEFIGRQLLPRSLKHE